MSAAELAERVARIRLAAEAALYLRLNAGAGFAEARLPAQTYLRDAAASARLARGTLRPEGTHRKALAEVQAALAVPSPPVARLAQLAARLGLEPIDLALIEVVIAHALDPDVRALIAALARGVTAELAAEVATLAGVAIDPAALVRALHPASPLRATGAMIVEGPVPACTLALGVGILDWLLGDERLPAPLATAVRLIDRDPGVWLPVATQAAIDQVATWLTADPSGVAAFVGPAGVGRRAAAHRLARALERPLLHISLAALAELEKRGAGAHLLGLALTCARLRGAVPYLAEIDALFVDGKDDPRALAQLAAHPGPLAFGATARGGLALGRPVHAIRLPRVELDERERAWQLALG
ncbi:MAG: hypothetical protein K8W52_39530, partial [Deltaproteobacteria bacterium]|nr:hypothetical protein [Deltaproteobacteria bacterium]